MVCEHPVGVLWNTGGMYQVEVYAQVRRSVYVEGLSERAAARRFGIARETVRKMLRYATPPGYRRTKPVRRPKLEGFTGIIDQIFPLSAAADSFRLVGEGRSLGKVVITV